AQQRRLAAAARPQERGERAARHLQGDVVEGDRVAEALGYRIDVDAHAAALPCHASRLRSVMARNSRTMRAARHRTTAPTYALCGSRLSMLVDMKRVSVCVLPAMAPETMAT